MRIWLSSLLALGLCWAIVSLRLRYAGHGLDRPNHRSLHERPVPHGGGFGIVAAFVAVGWWLEVPSWLLIAAGGLALVSLLDDFRHLPFWLRLFCHLAAASVICKLLSLPAPLWPPVVLLVAWMTNLYNFMDGADGLAGSQGVAGFSAYAAGFALGGDQQLGAWSAAAAGGCLGFLVFNWPPARIFMGDVGSIPLGFMAGGLGVWGIWQDQWPIWFPVLAFAPFVLDASVTLARRAIAGKRVWEAHREHAYQRMVQMGYGHRGMTLRWGTVMLAGSALAVVLLAAPTGLQWLAATVWLGLLVVLGLRIDRRWRESHA